MENHIHFYSMSRCLAPLHWHFDNFPRTNRLYVVYDGDAWFIDKGARRPFIPGRVYLIPYQFPLRVSQNPQNRLNHMYYDFSLLPPLLTDAVIELDLAEDTVLEHMTQALSDLLGEASLDETVITGLFSSLLTRICHRSNQLRLEDSRIVTVLQEIHQRYAEALTNADLARLIHLDVNHFIRIFKHSMCMTPHQYIIEHRLNLATSLVLDGSPVEIAAHRVGFESGPSLSRAMKKHRGHSLSEMVKKANGGNTQPPVYNAQ